jgi:hypothetical protein
MTSPTLSSGRIVSWLAAASVAAGLGLIAQPVAAQTAAPTTIRLSPEDEERGQHGPQHNFYFLPPGKTGEENYKSAGFFGAGLRPYIAGNTGAVRELDKYKRQKTLYLADKVVLVGAVGLYASQVFKGDDAQYFNSTQQVAAGLAVVSLLSTIFINRHTMASAAADGHGRGYHSRPSGTGFALAALEALPSAYLKINSVSGSPGDAPVGQFLR